MSDLEKYDEMFDYLRTVPTPTESAGLLVYGRDDAKVAYAAGDAIMQGLGDFIVITGSLGKDTGDLKVPEAHFLRDELLTHYPEVADLPLYMETKAVHGTSGARNGLKLMKKENLPFQDALTTVAHATSARRLTETTRHQAIKRGTPIKHVFGIASKYSFKPENPADQQEAAAELLRLADWPAQGNLQPQADLPENLVDFAHDRHGPAPKEPSRIVEAGFTLMPDPIKRIVFNYLASRQH